MKYSMEAAIEAQRLEEQVHQQNYSIAEEMGRFRFRPDELVLDAGCGTGVLSRYLVEQRGVRRVDAIDQSDLRIRQGAELLRGTSQTAIRFSQQDLSALPAEFHDRYDTVVCRYVLEHCEDPLRILGELRKATKKGGRVILFDLDGVFVNLHSADPKYNAYMDELKQALRFDLHIGRKLPSYLKQAGFSEVTWESEQIACTGLRLREERDNTEKRFSALIPFLTQLFGTRERCDDFVATYLREMDRPENTLVFSKFICSGRNE